jgi:hypothetical protein
MDCPKLKTSADTIVIDAMANNAFLGTDEGGLVKSGEDGWYHLIGDLQLAPISAFRTKLRTI